MDAATAAALACACLCCCSCVYCAAMQSHPLGPVYGGLALLFPPRKA